MRLVIIVESLEVINSDEVFMLQLYFWTFPIDVFAKNYTTFLPVNIFAIFK